jgi:hypothetical protein
MVSPNAFFFFEEGSYQYVKKTNKQTGAAKEIEETVTKVI